MENPCIPNQQASICFDAPFQCPCSKIYKSYPALYTHIKNKHSGKAPGQIKRSNMPSKKRGKPSINKSQISLEKDQFLSTQSNLNCESIKNCLYQEEEGGSPENCIARIDKILDKMILQDINKIHLREIEAIMEMNVYISAGVRGPPKQLVGVITQFLEELAKQVSWQKFKHYYILLMVFLQFTLDETGYSSRLNELTADTLCHHINNYISFGVDRLVRLYKLQDLEVFKHSSMLCLLQLFFKWAEGKQYTSYKITLNKEFRAGRPNCF